MTHEPECAMVHDQEWMDYCICEIVRAAYQRRRDDASEQKGFHDTITDAQWQAYADEYKETWEIMETKNCVICHKDIAIDSETAHWHVYADSPRLDLIRAGN